MRPFLVAFEPELPQNVGSLIRLSACFGTKLVIIRPFSFIWDPKKLKHTALDYLNLVEIQFFDSFNDFQKTHQGRIIGTSAKATMPYHKFEFQANDSILLGKESTGLPDEILNVIKSVSIPIQARSLNLASAASILLSHACLK